MENNNWSDTVKVASPWIAVGICAFAGVDAAGLVLIAFCAIIATMILATS